MRTKKLTLSSLFIALGTLTGHIVFIPVGVSKCFPVQHLINVLSAVLLGPGYAVWNALAISVFRNILGVGSPLAFPGSIFGALFAGLAYQKWKRKLPAVIGEVAGTSILGGLASYPLAKYVLGQEIAVFFFVVPFLVSTLGGSVIAYVALEAMENGEIIQKWYKREV